MKFRKHQEDTKVEMQMSAMIDIVFQLLIFFLLTLKIIPPEGDFNINMPLGQTSNTQEIPQTLDLKVRLAANPDGSLNQLYYGELALGNAVPESFDRLNAKIGSWVGSQPGATDEMEVELITDYNLHYRHIIKAVSACRGRVTPSGKRVTYIEKIKFAPIQRPGEA